jgi:hypothetical protein
VESAELFEAIHPHGHDVYIDRTRCASCRRAIATNGFCSECHAGYLKSQAYFSRLAYILAQGETVDASKLACATCRRATRSTGWCDRCALGWWGNIRYRDREKYALTEQQSKILHAAIKLAQRCEFCAMALIADARCHKCKISYADGKAIAPTTEVTAHQSPGRQPRE